MDEGIFWEGIEEASPSYVLSGGLRLLREVLPERPLMVLCKIGRATIEKATNRLHTFKKVETSMMRKTINPQIQEAQ